MTRACTTLWARHVRPLRICAVLSIRFAEEMEARCHTFSSSSMASGRTLCALLKDASAPVISTGSVLAEALPVDLEP